MADSELQKLGSHLERKEFRDAFVNDHKKAMTDAGIDIDQIDPGVLATLKDLKDKELKALSDVKDALRKTHPSTPIVDIANMV
jgi:methionine synthase II (cobalamin-independent)